MIPPTFHELFIGIVTHLIVIFALWLGSMAVALAYLGRRELSSELRSLWTVVIAMPLLGPITFFFNQWKLKSYPIQK